MRFDAAGNRRGRRAGNLVIAMGLALALFGCGNTGPGAKAVAPVVSPEEYRQTLSKVQSQSQSLILAYDEGEALDDDGKRRLAEADERTERLAQFDPTNPALFLLRGKFSLALGDSPQAIERFTQALALLPDNQTKPEERVLAGEAYGGLARAAENQRNWEEAEVRAAEAIQRQPKDPRWLTIRASALVQLKRIPEAREALDAALKQDPNYPRAVQLKRLMDLAAGNG